MKEINSFVPPNLGWLEVKLDDEELKFLWDCVNTPPQENKKPSLAGNISESWTLIDKDDWFFNNTLSKCMVRYAEAFKNLGEEFPTPHRHPYFLESFWSNYQKENEFNPIHKHSGIYSFVIWLKIPTSYDEQTQNPIAYGVNADAISNFQFVYTDIIGRSVQHTYQMDPQYEGCMVFFPAALKHTVYPFYNCKEDRISISGNIGINSSVILLTEEEAKMYPEYDEEAKNRG